MLGRKVDLNTPQFLGPRLRDAVLREADIQYAAALAVLAPSGKPAST